MKDLLLSRRPDLNLDDINDLTKSIIIEQSTEEVKKALSKLRTEIGEKIDARQLDQFKDPIERELAIKKVIAARINKPCDPDTGETYLHLMCFLNKIEICKILLLNGADPNIQDKDGNTPLHHIAKRYEQCVYNIYNPTEEDKRTILSKVYSSPENIKKFRDLGPNGEFNDRLPIIGLLLKCSADAQLENNQGKTAYTIIDESTLNITDKKYNFNYSPNYFINAYENSLKPQRVGEFQQKLNRENNNKCCIMM